MEDLNRAVPEYNSEAETLQEYCEDLKRIISDHLISFRNEAVRVRTVLVQIRQATSLNAAKRLAREFMEERGGS